MGFDVDEGFLDLTLDLQERGAHARILGLTEEDCAGLVDAADCINDVDPVWSDFCRFGWAIEDAFRVAGLEQCVVSAGGLIVVRDESLPLNR